MVVGQADVKWPMLGLPVINLNQQPNLLHRHLLSLLIRQSVISRDTAVIV